MYDYSDKRMTAAEAASHVRSGDVVVVGAAACMCSDIMDALWERRDELDDVTLISALSLSPSKLYGTKVEGHNPFRLLSFFKSAGERVAEKNGIPTDYTSIHLSQMKYWYKEAHRPDVVFIQATPPDENGWMSLGPSGGGGAQCYAAEVARETFVEVNDRLPWTVGDDCSLHVSQVSGMVDVSAPLPELPDMPADETTEKIARIVCDQIDDGSTIQLGIGGLSTAIGNMLTEKNDLGVYTELLSNPIMRLMKNGNVSNLHKGFYDGVSVYGFAQGSGELYEFIDHNPQLFSATLSFMNDPRNVAKNRKMMSINTAMAIDLYGQVAADNMGGRQVSAVGGQIDFVKGSQWSEGGKSFIAMSSCYKDHKGNRSSRIMVNLPKGTAITTPRSEVEYVVTEYGIVNLKPLPMRDRAKALIGIAHPDFRDQLTDQARENGLL